MHIHIHLIGQAIGADSTLLIPSLSIFLCLVCVSRGAAADMFDISLLLRIFSGSIFRLLSLFGCNGGAVSQPN